MTQAKRRWLLIAAGYLLLAVVFGSIYRTKALYDGDPDRYYHMALSRMAVESHQPFLRTVPQVEGLGWDVNFLDKEFLFHEVTTLGYLFGGDRGVEFASLACALGAILVFFLFAAGRIPLAAAVAITGLTFSSPYLAFRMALLRPHTLAVLTFILMNATILARRPKLTALATALFVLSYHAFYVSLVCMGITFVLSWLEETNEARLSRRVAMFGAFGCVAGLLTNPYFPGNILLAAIHARIPELMEGALKGVNFGEELIPIRADGYWAAFNGPLIALFATSLLFGFDLGRKEERARSVRTKLMYLLAVGGFFLVLAFQIARAGEYLIPACGLALVLLAERWADRSREIIAAAWIALVAQACFISYQYRDHVPRDGAQRVAETFKAIAAIPASPAGAKVFNCEWDRTPYLMYARPDLRFIDIMDPSLLYFANVAAFRGREELRHGTVADAYGLIHNAFKADYVLCGDPTTNAQLRNEPGLQPIYPKVQFAGQSPIVLSVFKVLPEGAKAFATSLVVRDLGAVDDAKLAALKFDAPAVASKLHKAEPQPVDLEHPPYLNLSAFLQPAHVEGQANCAFVSPSAEEVKRLAGARYVGVGGGPGMKLWHNGQPLFTTRIGFPNSRSLQVLVPLKEPLRAGDRIDLLACMGGASAFWGGAISLWTDEAIKSICDRKSELLTTPSTDPAYFPYQGLQSQTCIAPVAAPAAERMLGVSHSRK